MRARGVLMLLLALVAGVVAVALAARWMQQQSGKRTLVAVAKVDIDLGTRIIPEMVLMAEWPAANVPPGAFTEAQAIVDRVVITSLQKGEPILAPRLAPEGSKGGLSSVVAEGKRAMTVRVNDVVGVAGFALPGTYVDVMVHTQAEGGGNDKDKAISKIVLERILVLAAAQEADRDSTKPKVVNAVTLELTPTQAELLDLARSVGTLSLVLRNQTEKTSAATEGMTKAELLGLKAEVPKDPAPKPAAVRSKISSSSTRPVVTAAARPASAPARAQDCVELIAGPVRVKECF